MLKKQLSAEITPIKESQLITRYDIVHSYYVIGKVKLNNDVKGETLGNYLYK